MFSPSHIIIFLISAHIALYRQRKSGHHFGTKAVKIIVVISVITGEKVCICNGFHSSMLLNIEKSNTIFYFKRFKTCGCFKTFLSMIKASCSLFCPLYSLIHKPGFKSSYFFMIGKAKCRVPHGHTAFHFSGEKVPRLQGYGTTGPGGARWDRKQSHSTPNSRSP